MIDTNFHCKDAESFVLLIRHLEEVGEAANITPNRRNTMSENRAATAWASAQSHAATLAANLAIGDVIDYDAAGTAAWARRHDLDPRQHVPADLVRRLAKRNRQALRVVEFAERRTLDELHRGYSLISDHRQEMI